MRLNKRRTKNASLNVATHFPTPKEREYTFTESIPFDAVIKMCSIVIIASCSNFINAF